MRSAREITKLIQELWISRGESIVKAEYISLSNRIKALQTELVAVHNATNVNEVAYVNKNSSIAFKRKAIEQLTDEQIESLSQYANAGKMRPNEFPDEWRDVPTSQEEITSSDQKEYWLSIANNF